MPFQTEVADLNRILADCQEEYSRATTRWKPDPGEYVCMLADLAVITFEDRNDPSKKLLGVRPVWTIYGDTNLDGATFHGDMRTTRNQVALQQLRTLLEILNGGSDGDLKADLEKAQQAVGNIYRIRITERGEYRNDRVMEMIATAEDTKESGSTSEDKPPF